MDISQLFYVAQYLWHSDAPFGCDYLKGVASMVNTEVMPNRMDHINAAYELTRGHIVL